MLVRETAMSKQNCWCRIGNGRAINAAPPIVKQSRIKTLVPAPTPQSFATIRSQGGPESILYAHLTASHLR
jgi:hypothetical protein